MGENGLLDKGRQIDKRSQSHHDALWRAWYIGLQAITIPATAFEPEKNLVKRSQLGAPLEQQRSSSVLVEGAGVHWNTLIDQDDTIKPIDDISSVQLSDPIQNDESFDSMTLTLTMATAPIVDENQL